MAPDLRRSSTPPDGSATLGSTERYRGKLVTVRTDELRVGDHESTYDIVEHAPAAAVVALDDAGRVLLVRQWRHAIGAAEWELPAGLQDDEDGDLRRTAERELAEETGVTASSWQRLVTMHTSPGYSTERVEVFLATGARTTQDPQRDEGEAGMTTCWADLADAVAAVRDGQITNALSVAGLLALAGPVATLPQG